MSTTVTSEPARHTLDLAAVLRELTELGPPSQLREQAPSLAASVLELNRVLLTSITGGQLMAEALHNSSVRRPVAVLEELRATPVSLEYPLIEGEILRRRRPQLIHADAAALGRHAFGEALEWSEYVTSPILLDGHVVGFFHGDRNGPDAQLFSGDADDLGAFAACFALVFERAVLRTRLRAQEEEMRRVANWAHARTSELGERSISLSDDAAAGGEAARPRHASHEHQSLTKLLTRREIDVLELMVRGETNAAIARELVVASGTVKFHVKNILRKLHAANRAEATSRYLRLTLNRDGERAVDTLPAR